jgi:hypothetical protein
MLPFAALTTQMRKIVGSANNERMEASMKEQEKHRFFDRK